MKFRRMKLAAIAMSALMAVSSVSPAVYAADLFGDGSDGVFVEENLADAEAADLFGAEPVEEAPVEPEVVAPVEEAGPAETEAGVAETTPGTVDGTEKDAVKPVNVKFYYKDAKYGDHKVRYQLLRTVAKDANEDGKIDPNDPDETYTEYVDEDGDSLGDWFEAEVDPADDVITEATCKTAGTLQMKVTISGVAFTSDPFVFAAKLEHQWDEENVTVKTTVAATCTQEGSQTLVKKCKVCGETEEVTESTPMLPHLWTVNEDMKVKLVNGYEKISRLTKDSKLDEDYCEGVKVDANGNIVLVNPQQTGWYKAWHYCKNCGTIENENLHDLVCPNYENDPVGGPHVVTILAEKGVVAVITGFTGARTETTSTNWNYLGTVITDPMNFDYSGVFLENCGVAGTYKVSYYSYSEEDPHTPEALKTLFQNSKVAPEDIKNGKWVDDSKVQLELQSSTDFPMLAHHVEKTFIEFDSQLDKDACIVKSVNEVYSKSCKSDITYHKVVHCVNTDSQKDGKTVKHCTLPSKCTSKYNSDDPKADHNEYYVLKSDDLVAVPVTPKNHVIDKQLIDALRSEYKAGNLSTTVKFEQYIADEINHYKDPKTQKKTHEPDMCIEIVDDTSNCLVNGVLTLGYKCYVCGEIIDTEKFAVDKCGHQPLDEVVEGYQAPTCTDEGSFDAVVYCERENCPNPNRELSRRTVKIPMIGHTNQKKNANVVPVTYYDDKTNDNKKDEFIEDVGKIVIDEYNGTTEALLEKWNQNGGKPFEVQTGDAEMGVVRLAYNKVNHKHQGKNVDETNYVLVLGYEGASSYRTEIGVYTNCDTCSDHKVYVDKFVEDTTDTDEDDVIVKVTNLVKEGKDCKPGTITFEVSYRDKDGKVQTAEFTKIYYSSVVAYDGRTAHTWEIIKDEVVKAPTTTEKGIREVTSKCKVCGELKTEQYDIDVLVEEKDFAVTLAGTSYVYAGSAIEPAVSVKDGEKDLVAGTDYEVTYTNNDHPGKATVTVTGKGDYAKVTKTATFSITLATPELVSAKATDYNAVTVTWKAVPGASAYRLYYRGGGMNNWKAAQKGIKGTSYTFKSSALKIGTLYRFTVRAVYNGTELSDFQRPGVYAKPYLKVPTLNSVKTVRNGIQVTWGTVSGATGYYVLRKVAGGQWGRIATIPSGTTTSWVDTGAKVGKTYSYCVRAYYADASNVVVKGNCSGNKSATR